LRYDVFEALKTTEYFELIPTTDSSSITNKLIRYKLTNGPYKELLTDYFSQEIEFEDLPDDIQLLVHLQ